MSFMQCMARQGRKKSPMANSKRHPGGQQFANCEWGYPFCRRQSSFLANIPWYFSPPGGHISFHLVHFGWQASSSLRNLRGITVSSSSYTTRWQPFSSRHDSTILLVIIWYLCIFCIYLRFSFLYNGFSLRNVQFIFIYERITSDSLSRGHFRTICRGDGIS